jgi:hypothetical protein
MICRLSVSQTGTSLASCISAALRHPWGRSTEDIKLRLAAMGRISGLFL